MDEDQLQAKMAAQLAALETQVDHLESELTHLDGILKECGFPEGITTLKSTVEELLSEVRLDPHSPAEE